MSDIGELQSELDEAKDLVVKKVVAYAATFFGDDPDNTWRTWCDIDESLEQYWEVLNRYVACEVD